MDRWVDEWKEEEDEERYVHIKYVFMKYSCQSKQGLCSENGISTSSLRRLEEQERTDFRL